MSKTKELRNFLRSLERAGWTVTQKRKSFHLRSPKGGLVSCSISPSCPYFIEHIKADIRRLERREK